jgi:hypothetical protein
MLGMEVFVANGGEEEIVSQYLGPEFKAQALPRRSPGLRVMSLENPPGACHPQVLDSAWLNLAEGHHQNVSLEISSDIFINC